MEQKNSISFKEAFLLHKRGFLIFWKMNPKAFLSRTIFVIVQALTPYVNIYLSALLVNELAGGRNVERIIVLVAAVVLSTLGIAIASDSIKHWKLYENAALVQDRQRIYFEKMLSMDFVDMESQSTYDLYAQIIQNQGWSGVGIWKVVEYYENILKSSVSIIAAISLTVSLFTQMVPEARGRWTILNHPVAVVAILLLMFGISIVSSALSTRASEYRAACAADARFGNRAFGFFAFEMAEEKRAEDMRIYNQQNICNTYFFKSNSFGIGSTIDLLGKGKGGILKATSSAVSASFQGIIYAFVCLKAWAGAFGVGSVTQYVGAIASLSGNVEILLKTFGEIKANAPFMKLTFEYLDIPNNMYQGSLTVEKRSDRKYEIEFRNVSFRYPGSEEWALRNVSFSFRIGERLAVVGENGSGKTTFIKLLCRLYDPTEGQILLNGIDIRKYDYQEYMSIFSVVFQDFQLLAFSLGQNVAAGQKYDAVRAEKCLREAGFGERLESMPHGLETMLYKKLDTEGVEISGGEAQKIALARTLYKNAPFIILDEPTAALDPVAEQEVYENFNKIVGDKTAIYISHRLSSCRFCDVIAVFEHGSVVQKGSHEELVKIEEGKYHKLWYAQAQYYV